MPDEQGNQSADEQTIPDTPQHAYDSGHLPGEPDRKDEVEGDVEKLQSGDPEQLQTEDVAGESDDEEEGEAPAAA